MDLAYNRLVEQRPLVRVWDTNTRRMMSSGDVWVGQIWGADLYRVQTVVKKARYFIPEEGGVQGSDTMAIFSGAKHPVAAHLFINHMLDAHVAAENTNFIYYMGPNAAAKEFILPESSTIRRSTRTRPSWPSCRSCSTSDRRSETSTSSAGTCSAAAARTGDPRHEPATEEPPSWADAARSLARRAGRRSPWCPASPGWRCSSSFRWR